MKLLIVVTGIVCAFSTAFANVECAGRQMINTGLIDISANTTADLKTLDVSIRRAGTIPNQFNTASFDVTRITPMFPVYSVEAQKDLSDRDGALTKVTISISAEILNPTGNPAQITVESFVARTKTTKTTTYQVTCKVN